MKAIKEQLEVSPKPTDGRWSPTKCYYAIGEEVNYLIGPRNGEKVTLPAKVEGYTKNQYGRIGYALRLLHPIQGDSVWLALTEDIEGGPWHWLAPDHSHNVEFPPEACALKTCVCHERRAESELSYDDWCRLSQFFNGHSSLWTAQDRRISEWLKAQIARAK